MKNNILDGKAASVNTNSEENVLGYLFWYSLSDGLYNREDLRKKLVNNFLKENFLPNPIRKRDAFRRATKAIERKRVENEEVHSEQYENFIVRNVKSKGDLLQRNIVRESVDQKGQRLQYVSDAAKMYYDANQDHFYFQASDEQTEELAEEAEKLFELYSDNHNGQSVRMSVLSILKTLSPTPVRPSGGVYFIPKQYSNTLTNLKGFITEVGGESYMLPVVNDEEGQTMIADKLKQHLEKTLSDCHFALSGEEDGKTVQKGQAIGILNEARRVVSDYKDYRELVQNQVSDMENYINLIQQQVQLLLDKY